MADRPDLIAPVLIGIAVAIALTLMAAKAKESLRNADGLRWVCYGGLFKGLAVLMGVFGLVCLSANFFVAPKHRMDCLITTVLMVPAALYMVLETFFVRIGFDAERLHCYSVWRKKRVVDWHEVESLQFNPMALWHVIQTKNSGSIRVYAFMSGTEDLLTELTKRLQRGSKPQRIIRL
jgi:hypothetical protein